VHVPEPVKGDVEESRVREGAGGGKAPRPWRVVRLPWAEHEGWAWLLRGIGMAIAWERVGDAASRHDPMRASAGPIMRLGWTEDAVSGGGRRGIRWGKTRYPVGEDAVSGGGRRGIRWGKTRYRVGEDAVSGGGRRGIRWGKTWDACPSHADGSREDAVSGGGRRGIRWGKTRYPVGEDAVSGGGRRGIRWGKTWDARGDAGDSAGEDAGCARGCRRLGRGRRGMAKARRRSRDRKTRPR
jgi:hypothetical protein